MKAINRNIAGAVILGLAILSGSAWACNGLFCLKNKEASVPAAEVLAVAGNTGNEKNAGAEKSETGNKAKEEWIALKVEGMTCGSCEFHVKRALKKVPGVREAKASTEKSNAEALVDPTKVKPGDLVDAINKIGYKASLPDSSKGG